MRNLAVFVALIGSLAMASPALAADEPAGDQVGTAVVLPIDGIDDEAHPEVTITVTVPQDLVGLDLQPGDFFVSENDQARDVTVEQLPSDELAVVLVLDTSGSMRGEPLLAAKRAIESFLQAMPPGVQIALVGFGDTATVLAPFGEDYDAVLAAAAPLAADGETALYNGVILGADLFDDVDAQRRAMVVLSDGGDTASTLALEDALISLIDASPTFIAVELESSENDSATLQRFAVASEGMVVAASNPGALTEIYEETASDLVNQYAVRYTSESEAVTELVVAVRRDDVAAVGAAVVAFPPLPVVAEPVPEPAPEPEPIFVPAPDVVAVEVPWVASNTALLLSLAAVFAALAITFVLMVPTRTGGLAFFGLVGDRQRSTRFSGMASRATMFAEDALTKSRRASSVRLLLDQAGLQLRTGEFVILLFSVGIAAFAVGFAFFEVIWAVVIALGAVFAVVAGVKIAGTNRAERFRNQLPDTLGLISGGLRAGFGLNTAISAVADEQEDPTASEFNRVQVEVQLGRSIEDSLRAAAPRVQSEDLPWVADAIEIHRETGGDVADLLDGIAATVRERERVRGQIKVLSAEGRISGFVLVLMPFVLAAITYFAAPDYLAELTDSSVGRTMIALAAIGIVIGAIWIRRITRLKY
jgi:tight adherence protein B